MWFILLCTALPQLLFAQGDINKLILRDGKSPCEGHLQVYHKGEWRYVGDKNWKRSTEEVVCRSTNCGTPVSSKESFRPSDSKVWLNDLNCKGNESHLWDCENPGWGTSNFQKDTARKVQCSNNIKIRLDGFKCAGAVQYSTDGENYSGYICADNWGDDEANMLCQTLGCGTRKEIPLPELMKTKAFESSEKTIIKCSDIKNVENLWQCATTAEIPICSHPASVICTDHKRVRLRGNSENVCQGLLEIEDQSESWIPVTNANRVSPELSCSQMFCGTNASQTTDDAGMKLNCTDKVSVVLTDKDGKETDCYGKVHIKVNDTVHPVCASTWTSVEAEVVCRELGCGGVTDTLRGGQSDQDGIMDYVKCSGNESSLWHCPAKHREQNKSTPCSGVASVVCADSVDVRLRDGRGRCVGTVEIKYEGIWERALEGGWTDTNSNIVCSDLKCGKGRSFGPSPFITQRWRMVTCPPNAVHISDCKISDLSPVGEQTVMLICEDHYDVFLSGNDSCTGTVMINHGTKIHRLSGSRNTWNKEAANDVCQRVNCGRAINFSSSPIDSVNNDVSIVSYNCLNSTSLLKCKNTTLPSNDTRTVATVTCSERITANLTSECWGHVNICVGTKCGGVSKVSWTQNMSVMLCDNLGCGKPVQPTRNQEYFQEVIIASLYPTAHTRNVSQSVIVMKNDSAQIKNPAYVVCSGSIKTNIKPSRYKCSGNVEIFREGQWVPVCKDSLKSTVTQNTICRELKCGQAFKMIDYFGPTADSVISSIQCPHNDSDTVKDCNIDLSFVNGLCTHGGLQCSDWRQMELKFNQTCSGAVFVYSKGKRSAVSAQNWTETEGRRLCQDLKCGNFKSKEEIDSVESFWNASFSCKGVKDPESIWDCEMPRVPSRGRQKQLFIECQDEPVVTLSGKCRGEVKINNRSVCSHNWNFDYSHLACQEQQDCRDAVFSDSTATNTKRHLQHVACESYHDKLGQCHSFEGLCPGGPVSVYCIGGVRFKTTGRCGGQIKVNYRNQWENVCLLGLPSKLKDKLCQELGCQGYNSSIEKPIKKSTTKVRMETALDCTSEHNDIRYCVVQKPCGTVQPAEIYCKGYVLETTNNAPRWISSVLPIILGGIFLLLLIFAAVCIGKKHRKKVLTRIWSKKETEFKNHNSEDIKSKTDEMDFSRHDFRLESKVNMAGTIQRKSFLSNDDIELVETQHLTSETTTVGVPGQNHLQNSSSDHYTDGESYEVDDPRENYDDIEACSEITKVEVHDSHEHTSEIFTRYPGQDEDYLVPGIDG
ncbi:scavenger receptor cysteine-rich type 1 protein M160 [Takifugu flavidus]|uniref:scavenger receptor cysteine-rich type 1 protein M160 n=1 Tax=Takifugu flavidus TaxID=433684 RepID=UPI002544CE59|nr:scavenger receptor cysteine-rich type 1 protein M160 [Takifugu flavidus]